MKTTWFIGTELKGYESAAEMLAEMRRRAEVTSCAVCNSFGQNCCKAHKPEVR